MNNPSLSKRTKSQIFI